MSQLQIKGRENCLGENEIIVSKTDLKGIITYANDVFCRVAGYELDEVMYKPHKIVRHPLMPACVFKYLWDEIKAGREVFASVLNAGKGDIYYWVFAHVTPSFDDAGNIIGYHSNRRAPDRSAIEVISGLYATLLEEEQKHASKAQGMEASFNILLNLLKTKGVSYEELALSL